MRKTERKRRFSEARTSRDDDQIGTLKPAGQLVQLGKARRHPNERATVLLEHVQLIEQLFNYRLDLDELGGRAALADIENRFFGNVDRVLDLEVVPKSETNDRCAGID